MPPPPPVLSEPSLQRNWMLWPLLAVTVGVLVVVHAVPVAVPVQPVPPLAKGLQ